MTSFKRIYARSVVASASDPTEVLFQLMPLGETPGHSQASLAQSLCGVTAAFSWVLLMHKILFVPSKDLFPQSCGSSVIKSS